jgi:uncharacterized protein YwqG
MRSESLHARLMGAGLERVANDIIRLAMPSIRMNCRRATEQAELPLGCSKLGGGPDLRSGQSWPAWQGSPPMAFIGQVNLADIAAHDEEGHLPHSGLLSFFCAIDGTAAGLMIGDSSSWMVSHFDGDLATLVRLPPPPELPESLHFPACTATFSREPTLPDSESREILGLGLSETERSAYIGVKTGADANYESAFNHHLLGYPDCLGESPFIPGYLKAHGIPHPYTISLEGRKLDPNEVQGSREESMRVWQELQHRKEEVLRQWGERSEEWSRQRLDIQHKAEAEWRLLLQVYSNEEADMDFGGGGVLHFCIPKEALSRRDFGQVWVEMQFV